MNETSGANHQLELLHYPPSANKKIKTRATSATTIKGNKLIDFHSFSNS